MRLGIRWFAGCAGLAAVVIATGLPLVAADPSPAAALFQETLLIERAEGNLAGALTRYEHIVAQYPSERTIVAQALLQLGAGYERLGRPDARRQYERIIRDYADIVAAVGNARARLDALGGSAGQTRETGIADSQVWAGADANTEGSVSPDGRLLTFVDWSSLPGNGNVAVRDLMTGENRLLTHSTSKNAYGSYAYAPVPSPNGREVAYGWWDVAGSPYGLRVVSIDGSRDRVLVANLGGFASKLAWSPDGRHIAAALGERAGDNRIVLVSLADGSVARLKSTGWRQTSLGGFSPDGRWLTYAIPNNPSTTDGGVFSIAVDGGEETPLVQGPTGNTQPTWTPDGRAVVFLSNRSGTQALWSVPVVEGKPQGAPVMLRPNFSGVPMGFSRDGSYFYGQNNRTTDVYLADVDPATLEVARPPTRLMERFIGRNLQPAWSPDGRSIAFVRTSTEPGRGNTIVIRSLSDGVERPLTTGTAPEWFPDSRSVLASVVTPARGRMTFRRVEVETGKETVVFEGPYPGIYGSVAVDGRSLFYSLREEGDPGLLHLIRRDMETGTEAELYRAPSDGAGFSGISLSPDASRLAFIVHLVDTELRDPEQNRALLTIPTAGGKPVELYRGSDGCPAPRGTAWTKDSRYILAFCGDNGNQLAAYPAGGGAPRKNALPKDFTLLADVSTSPNGRQLVFEGRNTMPEVWTIKNLLSSATTR